MSTENYRYYCLDSSGRLFGAEWLHAETDDEAIAQIQEKHPDGTCEVWEGKRRVANLSPRRLEA